MFGILWERLPGQWWLKLITIIVLLGIVFFLIWFFVYPVIGDWYLENIDTPLVE